MFSLRISLYVAYTLVPFNASLAVALVLPGKTPLAMSTSVPSRLIGLQL